ncbi:MAG: GspH/FimT family protein [Gammaproteobacteria bacterium]|nr:GspH/FimT family protein [Gammaproteobacteria bacterium]
MTMHKRSQSGLTLPELIVSLSIISVLSSSGLSGLQTFIQENRMAAEINQFVTVLHLARSEAVKHGQRVLLCPSSDSLNCGNSKEWVNGWILFASEDREHDHDEQLLQTGSPISAGIRMTSSNYRKRIVYQPDGNSPGTNTSFTFCDTRRRVKPRVICLSNTGRPRLSWTRCDGKPISC